MTQKDEHRFAVYIAWLGTNFSKTDEVTREKIDLYFDFLKDLDIDTIERAVKKIIAERVYPTFPTIAEIREAALGNDAQAEDAALASWAEATRLISKGQRSMNTMINEAVVMAFGSWDRFGQTDTEMEAADRAHFIRCFRAIQRKQREYPGLRDARRLKAPGLEGQALTDALAKAGRGKP